MNRRGFLTSALAAGAATSGVAAGALEPGGAAAQGRRALRVVVFPGGFNWPIWIAQTQGFFARQGLTVELTPTPGSVYQMTHLIAGDFEIAHTAIDNVIAYVEGQGEAPVSGGSDLVAVMGGDNGFLRLIVRPEIQNYADLRGKRLAVDALTTGYAFALQEMLERNGLHRGDYALVPAGGVLERWQALLRGAYAATLLVTPFEVLARAQGFRLLGNASDVLGRYQGVVGATRRPWAAAHAAELVAYIRAYVAGLAWLYDPSHRAGATEILARNAKLSPAIAGQVYEIMVDPVSGFAPAATVDARGVDVVLSLRRRYATPPRALSDAARYLDLGYYDRAMGAEG